MKKYFQVNIPEHEEQKEEIFCDICGKKIESFMRQEVLKVLYGQSCYGEEVEVTKFDFCRSCIVKKVFPLLRKEFKIKSRTEYAPEEFD